LVRHDAEDGTLRFEGAKPVVNLVTTKREQILRLARRHGVTGVRVFGSMARGDAGPQSDVDLLVEVGPEPSPWFPGGLVAELEELLGRRVQVVTERGLDELLRERVLEEAVPL
jgi:predicted nucleotidyltransferase